MALDTTDLVKLWKDTFTEYDPTGNAGKPALKIEIVKGSLSAVSLEGDTAHDAVDAGKPVKIGGKASNVLPTAVAAGDRVNAALTLNGAFYVVPEKVGVTEPKIDVAVATTSTAIAAANTDRKGGLLFNDSDTKIYLGLGEAAVVGDAFILEPGDSWDFILGGNVWTGTVNGIHSGTGTKVVTGYEV